MPAPPEYLALQRKVDAFAADVTERREDLTCHAGCDACCRVELELCDVEADALRAALASLPKETLTDMAERPEGACALLDDTGRCGAYEARPLVCRSQGLALRYPPDTVPVEAVMGRAAGDQITWCPLNFGSAPPAGPEVLDAERVDLMLALVNRRVSKDPLRRTPVREIVRELARAVAR